MAGTVKIKLKNKFVVIIPVYNSAQLIRQAIESTLMQEFKDCGVIIRDDQSDDKTPNVIEELIGIDGVNETLTTYNEKTVVYIRNKSKLYGGGNTYDSVLRFIDYKEAIVGVVDGDDSLINANALSRIYEIYRRHPVYLVWSQHQAQSLLSQNKTGFSAHLPPDKTIYRTRNYWAVSHFRTCKAWLFSKINASDLMDPYGGGSYCQFACDAALLYPIIEMCGNKRSWFLNEVLYLYNDNLPSNESHISQALVSQYSNHIRNNSPRYKRLVPK